MSKELKGVEACLCLGMSRQSGKRGEGVHTRKRESIKSSSAKQLSIDRILTQQNMTHMWHLYIISCVYKIHKSAFTFTIIPLIFLKAAVKIHLCWWYDREEGDLR